MLRSTMLGRSAQSLGRSCPRPFTAATKSVRPAVFMRTAAPEQEAEVAEVEEMDPIAELFEQQEQAGRPVLDEEAKDALRIGEQLMQSYTLEAVLEAELEGATEEARDKALSLLEDSLETAKGKLEPELSSAALAAASGMEVIDVEEVYDYQGAEGFRKYDEEEEAAEVSEETIESIQKYKLSRQELATLLPKDWDTVNVDWFTSKKEDNIPLPEYKLTFLWQRDNICVAVDQVYSRGQTSPLTEFFVWPRKDAWEELKTSLEGKPIVSERDRVILLNRLTEVINFWQSEDKKPTLQEAQASFPDCSFA